MTVPEALNLIREIGGVEIRRGNLRVKFPEKGRADSSRHYTPCEGVRTRRLAMVAASSVNGKITLLPPGSEFKPTSEKLPAGRRLGPGGG
jgi:hypothetical protein